MKFCLEIYPPLFYESEKSLNKTLHFGVKQNALLILFNNTFPTSLFACDWKPNWSYRQTIRRLSFLVKSEICSWEHIPTEHSSINESTHSRVLMNLWPQQETTGMRGTQSTTHALSIWECKATDDLRLYEMEIHLISTVFLPHWPSDIGEQDWDPKYLYFFSFLLRKTQEL